MRSHLRAETILARQTAVSAGKLLQKGFGGNFVIDSKVGQHNLVTEFDNASEELIVKQIQKHYPNHSFLCEERGWQGDQTEHLWIIDPLDGTVNFAHNIPVYCVSIAYARHGDIVSAAIYHPSVKELFVAEKGKGATLNGKPISVTSTANIEDAIFGTGFPYNVHQNPLHCIEQFAHIIRKGIPVRRMGAAAIDLSYVAAGRYDAFWEVSLHPWDYAAGKLLVEEAGGTFTNLAGEIYAPTSNYVAGSIVASNTRIHKSLLKMLTLE